MTKPLPPTPPPLGEEGPFSNTVAVVMAVGVAASLVVSFLLLVFRSDQSDEVSIGSDSYSVSALGHQLLETLLRETGRPVSRSRFQSDLRARRSLLVLAEPPADSANQFGKLIEELDQVLVVLPKRVGKRDQELDHWIGHQDLRNPDEPIRILHEIAADLTLRRFNEPPTSWQYSGVVPELPAPTIADIQLLNGTGFRPLVRCREGTLLAAVSTDHGQVYVLADPDVMANHGLDDGDNAEFVLGMLDALRGQRGIVFDETLHGFELTPNVWEQLGRFPLVLLLAHLFLLLAVITWIAIGRFGPLLPRQRELPNDKRVLLDNTASLLVRGGNTRHAVVSYFRHRVRNSANRLGVRPGTDEQMLNALTATAARRSGDAFGKLCAEVEAVRRDNQDLAPQRAIALARRIHEACEEIVHGSH